MARKKAFPLRIDERILAGMRRWSDDELRSVNAQIEYVLREALRRTGRLSLQTEELPPDATAPSGDL